ncbi:MAG: hypothetical protein V1844_07070 [Pseudomonadota bacterium]
MRAVEAVINVSPDGFIVVNTEIKLKPGLHKILIITDEKAVGDGVSRKKRKKGLLDLKPVHLHGWPKHSTFRKEEIYNDDGR